MTSIPTEYFVASTLIHDLFIILMLSTITYLGNKTTFLSRM